MEAFRMHFKKPVMIKSSRVDILGLPHLAEPFMTFKFFKLVITWNVASICFSLIFSLLNVSAHNSHEFLSTPPSVLMPLFLRTLSIRIYLINKWVEYIALNNFILEYFNSWKYKHFEEGHTQSKTFLYSEIRIIFLCDW